MTQKQVHIGDVCFGGGGQGWILGPCSLETRDISLRTADALAEFAQKHRLPLVFKGSFDKANRTRGDSPRGPGLDAGLDILTAVRATTGLPLITDVHETWQIPAAAEAVDALQIPAFLCRQTDLVVAAAASGLPVLIKEGQYMAPNAMAHIAAKADGAPILLAERGTCFGYHDLIVDYRGLPQMRQTAPVVFDGTHAAQQPSAKDGRSGGNHTHVHTLCRAAQAVGVDGFFLETHPHPPTAISDRDTQIPLAALPKLIQAIQAVAAPA